jgi:hypothetical protein
MDPNRLLLIVGAEVMVILIAILIFLLFQNRNLRRMVQQLKQKAQTLLSQIKNSGTDAPAHDPSGYLKFIDQQIDNTVSHHESLNSTRNIVLDIDGESALPHRTAALRHALLTAEKDAFAGDDKPDWRALRSRYEQIFSFLEDEDSSNNDSAQSGLDSEQLRTELENAKSRINNLEKFKQLYFDLEDKWQSSKAEAQEHFNNISALASDLDASGNLSNALNDYHTSYVEVEKLIERGSPDIVEVAGSNNQSLAEIQHLRSVAADQHRIIEGLQQRLRNASNDEERTHIVQGLQDELQKQMRFVQESETCIQLLEDELGVALKDVEQLKAKLNTLPQLKAEMVDTRNRFDQMELKYHTAVSENRKLQKKLKENKSSLAPANSAEVTKLQNELNEMSKRYNELEEKFLDLKLQS